MFIVTVEGTDRSSHTSEVDAQAQKQRFEDSGITNVVVVEKDTFEPPQPE